ncbi:DmsC/YnfH family molybdoenzyme membrane anchor subunit [Buttiauxella selenatireducens]|uniref:DmsC/YnfH family molybdoenzyme membrane anchor subunit n=1 Tax=Buttiauxella selenatireducens TaxID=3073902 RepID=A0ABY9SEH8_9ENTR|nr:DmsC/YnfH family molybdoenzyme membrane anchor subunit [Buttiauxella sp. R73]WMY75804.1 DmsC/YnfH family molybdoenzyme membrane anchor subunit [Buttiauxella sp. R73]
MQEWPLIVFTLLVQASVGATVMLSLFLFFGKNALTRVELRRYVLPVLLFAVIAAALGLTASTLHLGYPLNAFNALRHAESSWLSREIIFASLYLAAVGFAALLALFWRRISLLLLLLASVLGIIDVYCMGAIYVHAFVATWMHCNTWVMFFGTLITLGATMGLWGIAACVRMGEKIRRPVATWALIALVAATLIRLLEQMSYFSYLADSRQNLAVTFPHQPLEAFASLHTTYLTAWIVLIAGIVLQSQFLRARGSKAVLTLGCVAVVVAEIILRVVFFSIN